MERPYRDADWLRRRYHEDGATQKDIAEECDVSPRAIRDWMNRHDIETREVRGENHGLYGKERRDEVKERISKTLEGREFDEEWRANISEGQEGRSIREETRNRISDALSGLERPEETRTRMSEARRGEKNPMYVDGEGGHYGAGWKVARRQARERDEVCQSCGEDGTAARLEVHHIVPISRFRRAEDVSVSAGHDLSNLVLLCRSCHMRAEYGNLSFESGIEDPLEK